MSIDFSKIAWMPVDLPKFTLSETIVSEYIEQAIPYAHGLQKFTTKNKDYSKSQWIDTLSNTQTKLVEYLEQHIPFTDLVNVKIHRMDAAGPQHRHLDFFHPDTNPELYKHNLECEPCGYRMILKGAVKKALAIETSNGVVYPELPEDTDWYVMGHTNVWHWNSEYDPDRYIMFLHIWLNKEQHFNLLEKSYKKYEDYVIWTH